MIATLLNRNDDSLKRWIAISLLAHIVVFIFFVVRIAFFPSESINYQTSVRVDIVGLPEKRTETDVAPAPTVEKEVQVSQQEKVVEKVKEKKKPEAIDLKKKQSKALERLKALQELEEDVARSKAQQKKSGPIKGNALAAGTSIRGLNKLEYDTYIGDIDVHIKNNWILPEWLAKAGLRARVLVRIDENGHIAEKRLIQSSNNTQYDAAALDAVARASPFPPPPEKFINIVGIDGIIFQFPD